MPCNGGPYGMRTYALNIKGFLQTMWNTDQNYGIRKPPLTCHMNLCYWGGGGLLQGPLRGILSLRACSGLSVRQIADCGVFNSRSMKLSEELQSHFSRTYPSGPDPLQTPPPRPDSNLILTITHRKCWFSGCFFMFLCFLTFLLLRNVRATSGPKSLCLCCWGRKHYLTNSKQI